MRRFVALLALAAGLGGIGLAFVACGGNDKPPLTPDLVEPEVEAGAPGTPPTTPAK